MFVFNTDLDNTIIYSYKHDIGQIKRNVEIYQGREISFVTETTFELLKDLKEKILIVPTTTRTIEQYNRIDLGVGSFKYALVCNGGILLKNGAVDKEWYAESQKLICNSLIELEKANYCLDQDERRYFELRFIEELFIFTKCKQPENVISDLKARLDLSLVDVFNNGEKVYVVPKGLSKGDAIKRFKKQYNKKIAIAAGDSEFDIPMLQEADYGLVPYGFEKKFNMKGCIECSENIVFSDDLLHRIKKLITNS